MTSLKGAFIGFGNIAELGHWSSYTASKEAEMVAIMDPSTKRQDLAKVLNPSLRIYDTVDDLLAKEKLDFVDICTPPASHAALALKALEAGCHVLCEKPLSLKASEYQDLGREMAHQNKTLFTVHNWKYAPIFQKAFSLIREGRIGPVWHVELFTLRNNVCKGQPSPPAPLPTQGEGGRRPGEGGPENWRLDPQIAGGGILVDHGWHSFYLLLNLVQALPTGGQVQPERVLAKMLLGRENSNNLEEAAQVLVQFPEVNGYIHLTWRSQIRRNSAIIQGQKGTLLIDDDRLLLTTHDGEKQEIKFEAALSAGSHHADWFQALLPEFIAEIKDPAKRGANFQEAGWCLALTQASYASNLYGFKEVAVTYPDALQEPATADI
jgi:predicted dehydrogenase